MKMTVHQIQSSWYSLFTCVHSNIWNTWWFKKKNLSKKRKKIWITLQFDKIANIYNQTFLKYKIPSDLFCCKQTHVYDYFILSQYVPSLYYLIYKRMFITLKNNMKYGHRCLFQINIRFIMYQVYIKRYKH